jgi:ketopantoate hydroxymethyltransferase
MVRGVRAYADDVRTHRYPEAEHTYSIDPGELSDFRKRLQAS